MLRKITLTLTLTLSLSVQAQVLNTSLNWPNKSVTVVVPYAAGGNLLARILSMGKLHHAMAGTAAVAIGVAAAVPGTLVNLAAGGENRESLRFGRPSGLLKVGAQAILQNGE